MKKFLVILSVSMIACFASNLFARETTKPILLDVRTSQEYDAGHLEGAILIPYDQIGEKIGSVVKKKSQKIYLYCRSGRRSKIATEKLAELGYKNVVDLGSYQDAAKTMNRQTVTP